VVTITTNTLFGLSFDLSHDEDAQVKSRCNHVVGECDCHSEPRGLSDLAACRTFTCEENGKPGTGNWRLKKPVNATGRPHWPVFGFLFSGFLSFILLGTCRTTHQGRDERPDSGYGRRTGGAHL